MAETLLLLRPTEKYISQYEDYRREFLEYGGSMDGAGGLRRLESGRAWLDEVERFSRPETVPEGKVLSTQFILVRGSDDRLLGMLQLRRELNEYLAKYAGHIGYSVRPSERRKGYAKRMLAMALDEARALGLERVMISCFVENEASRRTILANGGVFDSTIFDEEDGETLERYWIEL
ncbi:MAG: GNAT family N-acetyltransferase [Oscillospiraceae bacterium]|nr:GNAT family N-acetyltransferase [Oscillospiraceae bacterium]